VPDPSTNAIASRPSSSVPTRESLRLTIRVAWTFSPMTVNSPVLIYPYTPYSRVASTIAWTVSGLPSSMAVPKAIT